MSTKYSIGRWAPRINIITNVCTVHTCTQTIPLTMLYVYIYNNSWDIILLHVLTHDYVIAIVAKALCPYHHHTLKNHRELQAHVRRGCDTSGSTHTNTRNYQRSSIDQMSVKDHSAVGLVHGEQLYSHWKPPTRNYTTQLPSTLFWSTMRNSSSLNHVSFVHTEPDLPSSNSVRTSHTKMRFLKKVCVKVCRFTVHVYVYTNGVWYTCSH